MSGSIVIRGLFALMIGAVGGTKFSADPFTASATGVLIAIPAFIALTIGSQAIRRSDRNTEDFTDLLWEGGFLLAVLVIGSGIGMMVASAWGLSKTPQQIEYPAIIALFTTISLIIAYWVTSPVSEYTNIRE